MAGALVDVPLALLVAEAPPVAVGVTTVVKIVLLLYPVEAAVVGMAEVVLL